MHEHAVAVGDGRDDAGGDVVLRRKNARRLEVPIVGLGPEPRSRPGVDELGAHANGGTSLADASFQHVARAEFGAQGPLVSGLSLQAGRRGARDDRQIPKPRKPGRDLLAEAVGERLHLRVTGTLERKHRDPKTLVGSDLSRIAPRRGRGRSRWGCRRRRSFGLQVAQLVEDVARGLVAVVGVLREAAAEDPSHVRRKVRAELGDRGGQSRRIEEMMSTELAPLNGRSPVNIS